MFGYSKEAVRVKVKKCEGKLQPELRKFSVDPQITSLEVLQSILVKAFDIKSDFTLSYRSVDDYGQEIHLPLLSDWDLDAAFLKAHNIAVTQKSEPCVQLKVDMKPFAEASEDWEPPAVTQTAPIITQNYKEQPTVAPAPQAEKQESQTGFQGLIMNQVEKTFNMVSRALNLYEETGAARPPLADHEFRAFLDPTGQITDAARLREVIYCGGIDPSLRKVVWKHILNVYPDGMTGKERMDYIKRKANEYYELRARWKDCIQKGMVNADLAYVTGMVRKDVLRTDRHHNFYAGSDDNQNIASLFNILTTYALNHPVVSYCQGMSDLASPLLVTMGDEAHAYVCLCALMARLQPNFLLDGEAMTVKFAHLTEALQVYDPDFYAYLKCQQADDLLFCYRWLLLEMKREFAFEDALRMLEVLWASLPQHAPATELPLKEREFCPTPPPAQHAPPPSPLLAAPRENAYTKMCAIRRQSSSFSLAQRSLDEQPARAPLHRSLDDAARPERRADRENGLTRETKSLKRRSMRSVPEGERAPAWASTGDLHGPRGAPLAGQLRQLRDRVSLHNDRFRSLDALDAPPPAAPPAPAPDDKPKVKMIKNLNEFLNFAAAGKVGAAPHERLQRARSAVERGAADDGPRLTLTRSGRARAAADDGSSPDDSQEYYPMTTSMTRELRLELEHLDRQVFGAAPAPAASPAARRREPGEEPRPAARCAEDVYLWENPLHRPAARAASCPQTPDEQAELDYDGDTGEIFEEHSGKKSVTPIRLLRKTRPPEPAAARAPSSDSDSSEREPPERRDAAATRSQKFFSSMSQELENAKRNCESLLTTKQPNLHSVASTINSFQKKYEALKPPAARVSGGGAGSLPPPAAFGGGNPFLMFLCLTVLLQHRDYIMRNRMDYNELAMHFDKMVRKHNVTRVLHQARHMYALYLKQHAPPAPTAPAPASPPAPALD